jgi:S1-C subfamily serine protease
VSAADVERSQGSAAARPMPPPGFWIAGGRSQRAFLGVNIASTDGGGAVDGVLIEGVTPGGAAEAAGLEPGDVMTEVAGTDLAAQSAREAATRLIGLMEKATPGEPIPVTYRRGKSTHKVEVTPAEMTPEAFIGFGPGPFRDFRAGQPDAGYRWRHFGAMPGLELVELTPKLGRYFGAESGILVVRAPPGDRVPLEEGDVILSIGGRTPRDPAHAMQILASYAPGEELPVEILRDRKKQSLKFRLPESGPERTPSSRRAPRHSPPRAET